MKDLKSAAAIKIKGILFLLIGLITSALIVLENPTLKTATFLALAIWSFCRFYYFVFYVIEHYVDSNYRFAGLTSFFVYLLKKK